MNLVAPISYQGGKQRIADDITSAILQHSPRFRTFHDLCCGSGAVSISMRNKGMQPYDMVMLDASPWGLFWQKIGNGTYSLSKFKSYVNQIPKPELIQSFVKELSKQDANIDPEYVFPILQAASFGGKAIWIENGKWQNCSFRNYWTPTAKSNRRSHVNPMMPMPNTLYSRVADVCDNMLGVKGMHINMEDFVPSDGIVYIDPPYDNTTSYGYSFDVLRWISKCPVPCFVSEAKPLGDAGITMTISNGRKKGGISGDRKSSPNKEWLSIFNSIGAKHENVRTVFG